MELIADILLAFGALAAGFYCIVLGRRLNKFNDLENGVGGAVAILSAQVDDLTKTLNAAQISAGQSTHSLDQLVQRAEGTARQLELQMASLHDVKTTASNPDQHQEVQTFNAPEPPTEPMFVRRNTKNGAYENGV